MLDKLTSGLELVKNMTPEHKKKTAHGWEAITLAPDRYLLRGHSLSIAFYKQSIPAMILPCVLDAINNGTLGKPEDWPYEYHAQVSMWTACLYFILLNKGLDQEEAEAFISELANIPWEELSQWARDILTEVPQSKSGMFNFLIKATGDELQVRKLLDESQLDRKKLRQVFQRSGGTGSIICLSCMTRDDTVLAQMCLLAWRQGKKDEELLRFVHRYIRKVTSDDVAMTVVSHLIEKWETPLYPGSFNNFIRKCIHGVSKNEQGSDIASSEAVEAKEALNYSPKKRKQARFYCDRYTVAQASGIIGCSTRWLYNQINAGNLPNAEVNIERHITEQETIEKRSYSINDDCLRDAINLYRKATDSTRAELVKYVARKRAIGIRGAQKWIKTREDQGKSLQEIAIEAGLDPCS